MFGMPVLDVAIGLVFIFCLYSLLASTINEIIASILGLRAKKLARAIRRMLRDNAENPVQPVKDLAAEFYGHSLIKYMNDGGLIKRLPSYISSKNFSKVLIDVLRNEAKAPGAATPQDILTGLCALTPAGRNPDESDTLGLLQSFLVDANNDIDKFRASLEQWFDETMERATGWYKRQTQWIVFLLGFGLAVGFNIDSVQIVQRLGKDKTARDQLAQMASSYIGNRASAPRDSLISTRLDSLFLSADSLLKGDIGEASQVFGSGWKSPADLWQGITFFSLMGWLATALAISLGAPFWFDLLSKIVRLRDSGSEPRKLK